MLAGVTDYQASKPDLLQECAGGRIQSFCETKVAICCCCTVQVKMPAIAALAYHRASGRNISQPNQRLSYSENFLYMLDAANKPGYALPDP